MQWLGDQFGWDLLASVRVIPPRKEFFPDSYRDAPDYPETIFARVCEYMRIDRATVELRIYDESSAPVLGASMESRGAAGLYSEGREKFSIGIEARQFAFLPIAVATMAHELAHVHLLGHGRVDPRTPDHEPLADLLTVFMGLGLFTSSAALMEASWSSGGWTYRQSRRTGYLNLHQCGYAHSLFAWARRETRPRWARYLRPDVRSVHNQGLRYLRAGGHRLLTGPAPASAGS
jgi:hypothetical protein